MVLGRARSVAKQGGSVLGYLCGSARKRKQGGDQGRARSVAKQGGSVLGYLCGSARKRKQGGDQGAYKVFGCLLGNFIE
nr:hypothetical protein [Tanacetum cinerariifolium]